METAHTSTQLLRLQQVMQTTGLARSTIYKLMALHQFPTPLKLTSKTIAWPSKDIEGWIASRPRS